MAQERETYWKAESRKQAISRTAREWTQGLSCQPTKPAFHVWNLAVINNTYSGGQISTAESQGLKVRVESHGSQVHRVTTPKW